MIAKLDHTFLGMDSCSSREGRMIERCYKTLSLPVLFLPVAVTRLLAEIQGNKEATGTAWLSIKVSFPLVIALLSILPDPRYEKYNGSSNHSKSQVPNN